MGEESVIRSGSKTIPHRDHLTQVLRRRLQRGRADGGHIRGRVAVGILLRRRQGAAEVFHIGHIARLDLVPHPVQARLVGHVPDGHRIRVALGRDDLRERVQEQLGKVLLLGRREEGIKPVAATVEVGEIGHQTVDDPFGHDDEIRPARSQCLRESLGERKPTLSPRRRGQPQNQSDGE